MYAARIAAALALVVLVSQLADAGPTLRRPRRQLVDDNSLQPLDDTVAGDDEQTREKRKLEGVTQAKFGVKNALLGFVFGKINSLIDSKTKYIDTLDKQNVELNKQYNIEAPAEGGLSSLSGIFSQVIGPKLQLLGPKIQGVTSLFGGASGGGSSGSGGGSGLGSILSLVTSLSGGSSGGTSGGTVETVDSDEDES